MAIREGDVVQETSDVQQLLVGLGVGDVAEIALRLVDLVGVAALEALGIDNVWVAAHVLPEDRLLALTQVGDAFVWDLDPDRWSEQACDVANRRLTRSEWRAFLPDRPYEPACGS